MKRQYQRPRIVISKEIVDKMSETLDFACLAIRLRDLLLSMARSVNRGDPVGVGTE